MDKHMDSASQVVVVVTFALFVAALFIKGFGHDLLLEAGVFLVSLKLILMAYKNSQVAVEITDRLANLDLAVRRLASQLESKDARSGAGDRR
jgi:hypothetical protein